MQPNLPHTENTDNGEPSPKNGHSGKKKGNWIQNMLETRNENTQSTFNSIGIQVKH